jgi:16S rRNA (guanine1207-N2)-methyltransferase
MVGSGQAHYRRRYLPEPHQHFFTAEPKVPNSRQTITMALADLSVRLDTDSGVFSSGGIDRGTRILLEHATVPPKSGDILDLGCGYGPVAVAIAMRSRLAHVWAVDVNNRAIGLTLDNAARACLSNVTVARPDEVPETTRFSAIYSNPPIHIGKAALHKLLLTWLPRLTADGVAYMVVQKNLGSDSLVKWLNERGFPTERITSQVGYRILRTAPPFRESPVEHMQK